jgi:hypothetical protein
LVRKRSTRRKTKKKASYPWLRNILNSQVLPLLLSFSVLGILFVLIRMKGIEQDYKFNDIAEKLKVERNENKKLKANKARMLSVKKLRSFAKKHKLKEPDEKHIIIIP